MHRRAFIGGGLAVVAVAAAAETPAVPAEVLRYLKTTRFGELFQAGVGLAAADQGPTNFSNRILAVSPRDIDATVAPAFAPYLSAIQARGVADFFSTPLGQKVLDQSLKVFDKGIAAARDPHWKPDLPPDELRELDTFMLSPAGRLFSKLGSDPALRQEYFALIAKRYAQ